MSNCSHYNATSHALGLTPSSSAGTADSSSSTTVVAIICVVVSSLSTTFGLFFQKIAQERGGVCGHPDDVPKSKRIAFAYWFGGFSLITLVSFGLDLYSMASLGQSLVVPLLAGLEVAENQVFAPCVLHAELNPRYDYSAAVVVLFGAVLTSIWGPKGGSTSTGDNGSVLDDPCNATTSVGLTAYQETTAMIDSYFASGLFIGYEITVVFFFIASVYCMKFEPACVKDYLFLAYGYVAGFLGGQQNLFLKGVGTFFTLAFGGSAAEVFTDWYFYVFLLMMLVLAPTQLAVINVGLGKFSVLRFVPAYTVLYIIMGTSVGLFFYQEHTQLSEVDWIMFSIGFVFIFLSLGILGLKPETIYTLKMSYLNQIENVVWYPNVHDPEDNILALKKRAALQFNVEDISDYVLLLDGDEVDSDVFVVDALVHIQQLNQAKEDAHDMEHVVLLFRQRAEKIAPLTKQQSAKARGSWHRVTNKITTQLQVVKRMKAKGMIGRTRRSIWNLITHRKIGVGNVISHETATIKTPGKPPRRTTLASSQIYKTAHSMPDAAGASRSSRSSAGVGPRSSSLTSKGGSLGRNRTQSQRRPDNRQSHVMIAFGGGLLMSHSMSHKKLKALSKTGGHKYGLRGRMLRAMSSKDTPSKYGSGEGNTGGSKHQVKQLSSVVEGEEEEEGKVQDSTGVDIEMGSTTTGTTTDNSSSVVSVVVGARVCLKVVVGMVGTVTGINGATATVTLDSWSLANGNSVTAYVQTNELNVL